jgi:hypothetical protein
MIGVRVLIFCSSRRTNWRGKRLLRTRLSGNLRNRRPPMPRTGLMQQAHQRQPLRLLESVHITLGHVGIFSAALLHLSIYNSASNTRTLDLAELRENGRLRRFCSHRNEALRSVRTAFSADAVRVVRLARSRKRRKSREADVYDLDKESVRYAIDQIYRKGHCSSDVLVTW